MPPRSPSKYKRGLFLKYQFLAGKINNASVDDNAVIEQDGDYLIISPNKDYNGTIVNLFDLSFILNVQSVNDKPLISKIENQKLMKMKNLN